MKDNKEKDFKAKGGKKLQAASYKLLAASHELRVSSTIKQFISFAISVIQPLD